MLGGADLLIAAEPAPTVVAEMRDAGFQWESAPIATDALVFLVNANNPVDSLTTEQVQKIYTGEITNWKEVGGEDRPILPFQRNAEAGSQTLMQKLVMGEIPLMEPPKDYTVASMEGLIEAIRSFDGSPGAIGYTVYYYANDMNMAEGLKVVSIDGTVPVADTIRSGCYPFTNPYYAAVAADAPADSPARQVFDWLQGPVGQSLVAHEGYVSILDDPAPVEWDLGETAPIREVYTRLSPEPLTALAPSPDYGPLLPYIGAVLPGEIWDYEQWGLVTRQGKIVVDPVYDSAWRLTCPDKDGTYSQALPIYNLCQTLPVGPDGAYEQRYALCALDGSWITGFDYRFVTAVDQDHLWVVEENGDGVMLDANRKELWRLPLPEGEDIWTYQGGNAGGMWWYNGVGTYSVPGAMGYVTLDGTVLTNIGQFQDIRGFHEGLSATGESSNSWGYINTKGEWVISPVYDEAGKFQNGRAIVERFDGTNQVIDATGKVLWESDYGGIAHKIGDGFSYFFHYEGTEDGNVDRVLACYDENFREIDFGMTGKEVRWADGGWVCQWDDDSLTLYSPLNTVTLPFPGAVSEVRDGRIVVRPRDPGGSEWAAYDMDGRTILPPGVYDYMGFEADQETGQRYFYTSMHSRYDLYGLDGHPLLTTTSYPTITGGLVSVRTDLSYGYQTLDGDWVFRISLMKSMGD